MVIFMSHEPATLFTVYDPNTAFGMYGFYWNQICIALVHEYNEAYHTIIRIKVDKAEMHFVA